MKVHNIVHFIILAFDWNFNAVKFYMYILPDSGISFRFVNLAKVT